VDGSNKQTSRDGRPFWRSQPPSGPSVVTANPAIDHDQIYFLSFAYLNSPVAVVSLVILLQWEI
jgi:hypothetical protein